jgi:hypothetical protein
MRRARLAFAVTLAVCLAGVAALGVLRSSDLVYTPGAAPSGPVATVPAGQRACQGPIALPDGASFDRVAFTAGATDRPTVAVDVLEDGTGRSLASGDVTPATAPAEHVVKTGRVETARPLRICFTARGAGSVAIYGQPAIASPRSRATLGGKALAFDLALELRTEPRSLIALLPTMAERASLFRAGWVTPLTYLLLALALVIGAPLALARGLGRAAEADLRD